MNAQKSPTKKMKQLSRSDAKSKDMSPKKLETTGRYSTAQPTYLGRIGSNQPKTVQMKDFKE